MSSSIQRRPRAIDATNLATFLHAWGLNRQKRAILESEGPVNHELYAHAGLSVFFEPGQTTAIPLAYDAFCATYGFRIAGYFFARRAHWNAVWTGALSRLAAMR